MAYGTPASGDDIEAYYTHIRRGRPPTAEQLDDLRSRYDAIGGISPLLAITRAQAAAIGDVVGGRLRWSRSGRSTRRRSSRTPSTRWPTAGSTRIVGVVLAPHYSRGSVGEYAARVAAAASARGLDATTVPHWHDLPEWRAFLADALRAGLASLPPRTKVVFTAHSLPERVLEGDPYPDQLLESAAAISTDVGLHGDGRVLGRVAVRGTDARAVARSRHPRGAARRCRGRRRGRGARLPAGVHGRPPRGALRPRRRSRVGGRVARARVRADAQPQRRPCRDARARGQDRFDCERSVRRRRAGGSPGWPRRGSWSDRRPLPT